MDHDFSGPRLFAVFRMDDNDIVGDMLPAEIGVELEQALFAEEESEVDR